MTWKTSYETGLIDWEHCSVTVASTGEVVVWGKQFGCLPNGKGTQQPAAFHIFSVTPEGWRKPRIMRTLCKKEHEKTVVIAPRALNNQVYLEVFCGSCEQVRLYDTDSGAVRVCGAGAMQLQGQAGSACGVEECDGSEFETRKTMFRGHLLSSGHRVHAACCIPGDRELTVRSVQPGRQIQATWGEKLLWIVKGDVDGLTCDPRGLLFLSDRNILLVADGVNVRVLAFDPFSGRFLKSIALDKHFPGSVIIDLFVCNDEVVVIFTHTGHIHVAYFAKC